MKLLILLVGSNPLPLFATAKFLLDVNNGVDDDLANPDKIIEPVDDIWEDYI